MSFDLMVLINQIDLKTQQRWVEKLKQAGIECQFPKAFSFDQVLADDYEPNEISIQYQFMPPLVKTTTQAHTFQYSLDPWSLDDDTKSELIESTEDESLQQRIADMKFELQLSSSAGRDDHALILQCFTAATLADACDGVLVDPQELGAVINEKVYQTAYHNCQHSLDELNKPQNNHKDKEYNSQEDSSVNYRQKQSPSIWTKLVRFLNADYNNQQPFSPYAISVQAAWKKARGIELGKHTIVNSIHDIGSEKYRKTIEKYKNKDFSSVYEAAAFKYGLILRLMKQHKSYAEYYFEACKELGEKVYENIQMHNEYYKNDSKRCPVNPAANRLETFLSWACAININTPQLPDKEKLIEGIKHYDEAFSSLKSTKGYLGAEEITIVYLVMTILADEYEMAERHIKRCKKDKEVQKQRTILNKIIKHQINNPNQIITNEILEKEFFSLFNAYRLPIKRLTSEYLGEYDILNAPFGNYVFAWLYLKLFKGQSETTWKELRQIMMW